jgi:hypothetical protein
MTVSYQQLANQLITAGVQEHVHLATDLAANTAGVNYLTSATQNAAITAVDATVVQRYQLDLKKKVDMVATLNESANANDYINAMLITEKSRVDALADTVKREQYKLRAKTMSNDYLSGYYRTATWVVVLTLVVTLVLLLPAALWRAGQMSMKWFAAVVLVVLLLYLAAIVLVSAKTAMRRYDAWNQYNWKVTGDMAKQLKDMNKAENQCQVNNGGGGPQPQTCLDACEQYTSMYSDQIDVWMKDNVWAGNLSSNKLRAWAHYIMTGQATHNIWPGEVCNDTAMCSDAKLIYDKMYAGKIVGDTYNDHLQNVSNRVWAGKSASAGGCL